MTTPRLDEATATDIVNRAVDEIGGTRSVYRNPRMAFSRHAKRMVSIDGHEVEIRYGEISTPAIATLAGWVFQINDEEIELLVRPPESRRNA